MKSINKLTQRFDEILQHDVEIKLGKKVIRKGTFILYTIKDFVITIHLKTPTSNKQYDMYYPYDVVVDGDDITMDYTIENLHINNPDIELDLQDACESNVVNKFYNQKILISIV